MLHHVFLTFTVTTFASFESASDCHAGFGVGRTPDEDAEIGKKIFTLVVPD